MFQIYAQGIHDAMPEPAAVDPAEADPKAMVDAAKKGDMAVVRKQLKAGWRWTRRSGTNRDRADHGG